MNAINLISSIITKSLNLLSNININGITYTFAIAWFFCIVYFVGKIKK